MARLENLLGVVSLAVTDAVTAPGSALPPSARAVVVSAHAHPGRPVSWVRDLLGLTTSGATRLVDQLEAQGLVERRAGADARTKSLVLTDAGEALAADLLAARARAIAQVVAPLDDGDRADLERILARLATGVADDRPATERACRMCDRGACRTGAPCPLDLAWARS